MKKQLTLVFLLVAFLKTPVPLAEGEQVEKVEKKVEKKELFKGVASYYSRQGCLGCNKNFIMANGEVLDDTKMTMALWPEMFRKYKNQWLEVENTKNGKKVLVKVTDTGGFKKYRRVADLSLATKNALGCQDLCHIKITKGVQK